MDALDVKILRALISESRASPSSAEVRLSLRAIAARIGADDMTVNYRYKRLQKSGALSDWHLILNPSFFGRSVLDVVVDVQPESEKADMIRKLKLVDGVIMILTFFGRALRILSMYSTNESRSRAVELITNSLTLASVCFRASVESFRVEASACEVTVAWMMPASATPRESASARK